jgi:hypothetical protein
VKADHHEADCLDADEGYDHAAETTDQQVAAKQATVMAVSSHA